MNIFVLCHFVGSHKTKGEEKSKRKKPVVEGNTEQPRTKVAKVCSGEAVQGALEIPAGCSS